jgi:glycosyltransferase involved in cell wall biosynthesis
MTLRVLMAHNRYKTPSGEDAVFDNEVALLKRSGLEVKALEARSDTIDTPWGLRHEWFSVWSKEWFGRIEGAIRAFRPDIAHFHNLHPLITPSVYTACADQGVAVVQTLHNYRLLCPAATFYRRGSVCELCLGRGITWPGVVHACYRGSRWQSAAVTTMLAYHRRRGTWAGKVNAYIALTQFARRKFIEGGIPPDLLHVKPNIVFPDPGAKDNDGEYGLFVGRLAPEKGIRTVLAAWSTISSSVPLRIIGDGPLRAEVEATAAGIPGVQFIGPVGRDAVLATMKAARFLVFSSEWYEGFPLVLAEAFACGVPVLAGRIGAGQEIVVDGRNGAHFAAGDPADLAEKAVTAYGQAERCRAWGRSARRTYEEHYSPESNFAQLMRIYEVATRRDD